MKIDLKIFHRLLKVRAYLIDVKDEDIIAYSNRTEDGFMVLFMDYDGMRFEDMVNELRWIQEQFKLSSFYLFEGMNGYHAICLDKLILHEYQDILRCSSVDENYIKIPLKQNKHWLLRLSNKGGSKIRFCGVVDSDYGYNFERSKAHATLLNNLFDLEINVYEHAFDEQEKVLFAKYRI